MWLWILLIVGSCFSTGVNSAPRRKYLCPPEFVRYGGSCYYFSKHMATWFEAHFQCKDRNSELAVMEKGWEDRNMRSYLNKVELARLERWLGGIYNWELKRWVWGANGGNPLKYQGFSMLKKGDDHRWECIIMDPVKNYKWSNRYCIESKHFICETPLKRLKPPRPHATKPKKPRRRRPPKNTNAI
ncbi:snaclec botrocetin subunit beta [Anabrus simplex]|uniref:snaclec botrocetin subunit beta n=1 Tax=Anabrus simplex TaxID=316456 RepID=UPI0035A2E6E5